LWEAAGQPEKGGWYLNPGVAKGQAMQAAESNGAYTVWGALPFLRFKDKHSSELEILLTADPILQRVMVAIVVNPLKIQGANYYALLEDLQTRGLSENDLVDKKIKVITYDGLVDLIMNDYEQLAWL
jgi:sulfur relay protein TusB/DsrH